jgi:hypothetical protein
VSAENLEAALQELGIRCTVEAMDRLAVVTPYDADAERETVRLKREALRLMRAHGFTNIALGIPSGPADRAALHRD